jgi:hypothetical protein
MTEPAVLTGRRLFINHRRATLATVGVAIALPMFLPPLMRRKLKAASCSPARFPSLRLCTTERLACRLNPLAILISTAKEHESHYLLI